MRDKRFSRHGNKKNKKITFLQFFLAKLSGNGIYCVSPRATVINQLIKVMKSKIETLRNLIAKAYVGYDNVDAIVSYTMQDIMRGLIGQEQFASSYLDYEIEIWKNTSPFITR